MTSKSFHRFTIQFLPFIAIVILFSPTWAASNGKVIFNFTGGSDGGDPATQLTFDSGGNAYGTTVTGGDFACGTVFQLTPTGGNWQLSTLYSFTCSSDGKNPYGGVALDAAGNLYGTTVAGGSGGTCAGDGCGTIYELTKSGNRWTETVLYNFTGGDDGSGPGGPVVFDNSGNLYGTTPDGGVNGEGVVYQLSAKAQQWSLDVIHAFTGGTDGGVGSLGSLLYLDGDFYGVTEIGGDFAAGTVFQLFPSGGGWAFRTIHQFQGEPHAGFPYGGLITDGHGKLLGTTYYGGADGMGTVFALARGGGGVKESVLHSFTGGNDGASPTSTPVFDNAGNLYVMTSSGGNPSCQCGTIFELSRSLNGGAKGTIIHSFTGSRDGGFPNYGLTIDMNGNLYGTTPVGGTHNQGVIFSFTP